MNSQVTPLFLYGLKDLIAGVTPTLTGWTADPTDQGEITDNDITTICTTGNKVAGGGYQYGYFEWDLGGLYNLLIGGVGGAGVTFGTSLIVLQIWNGAVWVSSTSFLAKNTGVVNMLSAVTSGSKVRIGLGSSVAATITPNIREFHVWRLE